MAVIVPARADHKVVSKETIGGRWQAAARLERPNGSLKHRRKTMPLFCGTGFSLCRLALL